MYELVKHACSRREKSFTLTVTERIRIVIGMNYFGSTVLCNLIACSNNSSHSYCQQNLLLALQDWHDLDCIFTQIRVNHRNGNANNLYFCYCLKAKRIELQSASTCKVQILKFCLFFSHKIWFPFKIFIADVLKNSSPFTHFVVIMELF